MIGWPFDFQKWYLEGCPEKSWPINEKSMHTSMLFDGSEPRLALYSSLISHFRHFRKISKKLRKMVAKSYAIWSKNDLERPKVDWFSHLGWFLVIRKIADFFVSLRGVTKSIKTEPWSVLGCHLVQFAPKSISPGAHRNLPFTSSFWHRFLVSKFIRFLSKSGSYFVDFSCIST